MKTYYFPSSKLNQPPHRVILHDTGAIMCSCWGFRSPNKCWHYREVAAGLPVGRTTETQLSVEDRRLIKQLLAEGNDKGAHAAAHDLFPSMSFEETCELVGEIELVTADEYED